MKLALACFFFFSSIAAAQATPVHPPPNVKTELVRLSFGSGFSVVSGPDAEVDGERIEEDGPGSLPMPNAVARVEVVLSDLFLLGVQSSFFMYEVFSDEYFGGGPHGTIDVSVLPRLRLAFGSYRRHEIMASLPLGPSFDIFELGPRSFGGELEHELAWHAGLTAGYTYSPVRNPFGFFAEAGLIYHRVPLSIEYENATEELTYEPVEALVRFGMMIPLR